MEKHENVASILSTLGLHNIEEIISQPYYKTGPGRLPRSPLGILKAFIVMRMKAVRSLRRSGVGEGYKKSSILRESR